MIFVGFRDFFLLLFPACRSPAFYHGMGMITRSGSHTLKEHLWRVRSVDRAKEGFQPCSWTSERSRNCSGLRASAEGSLGSSTQAGSLLLLRILEHPVMVSRAVGKLFGSEFLLQKKWNNHQLFRIE